MRKIAANRFTTHTFPWRFQTSDHGGFDELVLGEGLHVEMMDETTVWLGIYRPDGKRWSFFIGLNPDGKVAWVNEMEDPEE